MLRVVLIAGLVLCAFAQDEGPPPAPETTAEEAAPEGDAAPADEAAPEAAFSGDAAIRAIAEQEEMLTRTYLELVLKVQAAYYNKRAAVATIQMFLAKNKGMEAAAPAGALPEAAGVPALPAQMAMEEEDEKSDEENFGPKSDFDLEEDDEDDADMDEDAISFLEMPPRGGTDNAALARVWLDMFTAIKVNLYQTVYAASDLQKEFFLNRATQLLYGSVGDVVPKEYVNLLYMSFFKTYISTQKLSKKFEMVSTWTTWLEDELDLCRAKAGDVGSGGASDDEIATDRLFAFQAFSNVAYLDLTEFMLQTYIEYQMGMLGAAAGGAQEQPAASFIEVEANTQTQSKFVPTMLQFAGHTEYATKLYKMYSLYYTYAAAQSGLQSSSLKFSKVSGKGPASQIQNAGKYSDSLYALGFASNVMYACDVDMVTAMWTLYNIVVPMFQQQEASRHAAMAH